MYRVTHPVRSASDVKSVLGPDFPAQLAKVIDHIDVHCRLWIERSPLIVVSSMGLSGAVDTSPKGDPLGSSRFWTGTVLAIPDRLGNHRGDTFLNVLENPSIGGMFVVPKRREVLRVSGTAQIARDPDLPATMSENGEIPHLALIARVSEAFFHCGKSMIRSGMWEPTRWGPIEDLPSYAQALKDHGNLSDPLAGIEQRTAQNESDRMY